MSGATPSGISSATMNYGCEHSSAWCSKAPTTQTWPGTQATQLVPVNVITTSQQSPTTANTEPFTRSGFSLLDMAGNLLNDDNKPTSLIELEYRMADPGRHSRGPSALCRRERRRSRLT